MVSSVSSRFERADFRKIRTRWIRNASASIAVSRADRELIQNFHRAELNLLLKLCKEQSAKHRNQYVYWKKRADLVSAAEKKLPWRQPVHKKSKPSYPLDFESERGDYAKGTALDHQTRQQLSTSKPASTRAVRAGFVQGGAPGTRR